MNLYPFLRRLRREAIPPVLIREQDPAWSRDESEGADPGDHPSLRWSLSEQDVHFLRQRLRIDPD
jgi:hypothetical protein